MKGLIFIKPGGILQSIELCILALLDDVHGKTIVAIHSVVSCCLASCITIKRAVITQERKMATHLVFKDLQSLHMWFSIAFILVYVPNEFSW